MSFFKNLFGKNETAEEKLATGELNWKLKPSLKSLSKFPNYKKFILTEEEKGFQFGLLNEMNDEVSFTLILHQPVYDKNDIPTKRFSLYFQGINASPELSFNSMMGVITDFNNPSEMNFPRKEYVAQAIFDDCSDQQSEIYAEKYLQLFEQAIKKHGLDTREYKLVGKDCFNKNAEKAIREQHK
ncbi:MAG: hypothetical protein PSX36_12840 [bacterium]|nr:hypothetical protein [bacterium]